MTCFKNKVENFSRQRRRTLFLRRLDNSSVMRPDTDPDTFPFEIYRLRVELSDLGEVVSTERLNRTILDVLPTE